MAFLLRHINNVQGLAVHSVTLALLWKLVAQALAVISGSTQIYIFILHQIRISTSLAGSTQLSRMRYFLRMILYIHHLSYLFCIYSSTTVDLSTFFHSLSLSWITVW
jgi:hypothetical protein